MKQVDYLLKVKEIGTDDSKAWNEKYSEIIEDSMTIEQHGRSIIERFNSSLRPYEKERVFISATPVEQAAPVNLAHDWGKISLVTEKGGYDRMKCKRCGATGKRFGLGQNGVKVDAKFKKVADNCPVR